VFTKVRKDQYICLTAGKKTSNIDVYRSLSAGKSDIQYLKNAGKIIEGNWQAGKNSYKKRSRRKTPGWYGEIKAVP